MIIAIDCDEVLSETLSYALQYHHYRYNGIPMHKKDMSDYYAHKMPQYHTNEIENQKYFLPILTHPRSMNIKPVV